MLANKHWPMATFILILVLLAYGLTQDPRVMPSALVSKPAPKFKLPSLLDDKVIVDSEVVFKGHQTVVNIWASWCVPCRIEHAFLDKIRQDNPKLPIIGINYKDDLTEARNFLETMGNPYTHVAYDPKGETGYDWGVYGTPETFLLDAKSRIIHRHAGTMTDAIWQKEFLPLLDKNA